MDVKALQLNSRFSLPPNTLGYCGKNTAPAKFIECVINGKCDGVEEELPKFIVLNPYLETLKEITKLDKYSYENIEAYWLGNEQLRKANLKHYSLLLENFTKQGVPTWLTDELKIKVPQKFVPNHLFQVLHVGVGKASGSVPYNIETINNCMVRWGEVKKIENGKLKLDLNSLQKTNNQFKLETRETEFDYRADFLTGIKNGDTVVVHWKQVVKILNKTEEKNLSYWTNEVLAATNPD
jgi:hypothetical protein